MFRAAILSLSVLLAAAAGLRAETVSFTRTLGPEDFTPEAMQKELGECVDKAIQMLSGEEPMQPSRVAAAEALIETQTAAAAYRKEWEGKPREQIARGLLGEERRDALEKACLAALESGDEDVRMAARHLLGESLGSRVREETWERELREAMEGFKRTGILPISLDECFSLAANLAYLGNPAGKEVLVDVLSSDSHSFLLRHEALKAMKALGELRPDGFLDKLLRSSDARIAYEAFDAVGGGVNGSWTTTPVMEAAEAQLVRLGGKYDREKSLSPEERHLLSTAGFVLVAASREGALPAGLAADAKAAVRHFVECADRDVQEAAALLFGELAGDEDEALLATMMASDSARLRSRGAAGLSRCSADTVERHLPRLRELQDDPSWQVRLQAANGLQTLANAGKIPADSFVSPMKLAGFEETNKTRETGNAD